MILAKKINISTKEVAGLVGGLSALVFFGLLATLPKKRRRRKRIRALAQAREELPVKLKKAAQRFTDPMLVRPLLENAIKRSVENSGEKLACAIGEQLAGAISKRIPRQREPVKSENLPVLESSPIQPAEAATSSSIPIAAGTIPERASVDATPPNPSLHGRKRFPVQLWIPAFPYR